MRDGKEREKFAPTIKIQKFIPTKRLGEPLAFQKSNYLIVLIKNHSHFIKLHDYSYNSMVHQLLFLEDSYTHTHTHTLFIHTTHTYLHTTEHTLTHRCYMHTLIYATYVCKDYTLALRIHTKRTLYTRYSYTCRHYTLTYRLHTLATHTH